MTNYEIKEGEIIRQNGIVNVLEQLGFHENEDFIFLRNGNIDPYILMDGDRPMCAIKIYSGKESPIQLYSEHTKSIVEIPVVDDYTMNKRGAVDENGYFRYGITCGNNGVGAVYVPSQGMIISNSYEIKNIMENQFSFKEITFFVPLSNGEKFRDKSLQSKWERVKNNQKYKDQKETELPSDQLEQLYKNKIQKLEQAKRKLQEKIDFEKIPYWAQEQLKNKDINM